MGEELGHAGRDGVAARPRQHERADPRTRGGGVTAALKPETPGKAGCHIWAAQAAIFGAANAAPSLYGRICFPAAALTIAPSSISLQRIADEKVGEKRRIGII